MKAASIHEIKQELQTLPESRLLELCLRLAKYKKENKELLDYLLFEAHDNDAYIAGVKKMMDEDFNELPKSTLFHTKKSLRKTLRNTAKYIKYTGSRQVEAELLIYLCQSLKSSGIGVHRHKALEIIYQAQIKKINAAIGSMHEDLQYDYKRQLEKLT